MRYYFFRILNSLVGVFSLTVFILTHMYFMVMTNPGEELPLSTNPAFIVFDFLVVLSLTIHFISQLILTKERRSQLTCARDLKNFLPLFLMAVGLMAVLFHLYDMMSRSPAASYVCLPDTFSSAGAWILFWVISAVFIVYYFYLVIKTLSLCGFKF